MSRTGNTEAQMANANHDAAPTMAHQRDIARHERHHRESASTRFTDRPQDMGLIPMARDHYDEKADIRSQLNKGTGQISDLLGLGTGAKASVQRTLPITEAELDWAQRVKEQQEQVEYDKWVLSKFDLTQPAEVSRVRSMFPSFWERQKKYVESRFAIMRRFVDVKMFGIQSEEDAKFLWLLENGHIVLPTGYQTYAELSGGKDGTAGPMDLVNRGMFNILNFRDPAEIEASGNFGYISTNPIYAVGKAGDFTASHATAMPKDIYRSAQPSFWNRG